MVNRAQQQQWSMAMKWVSYPSQWEGFSLWRLECPQGANMPPRFQVEDLLHRFAPHARVREYGEQGILVDLPIEVSAATRAIIGMELGSLAHAFT